MKKLLYINEILPFPQTSGGRIKSWQTISLLAQRYHVHVVCQTYSRAEAQQAKHFHHENITLHCVYNPRLALSAKRFLPLQLLNYLRLQPKLVTQFWSRELYQQTQQLLQTIQFEAIHISHLNMSQFLPSDHTTPWIYEEHNIDSTVTQSRRQHTTNLLTSLYLALESALIHRYEKRMIPQFDLVLPISAQDGQILHQLGAQKLLTAPLVFSPHQLRYRHPTSPRLLFLGYLNWEPNQEALTWFFEHAWPLILQRCPDVMLDVVGYLDAKKQQQYHAIPHVQWHGFQTQLEPFFREAAAFMMPIQTGGGVKLKTLTALSYGLPIVSTSYGVHGLDPSITTAVLVANTPLEFADQVIKLIQNLELRIKLRQKGFAFLKELHSSKQATQFLDHYQQFLNS